MNTVLRELLTGVQAVLSDQLVGIYIHGSLALNDFTPHRSDIDVIIITADTLSPSTVAALGVMHERMGASDLPWQRKWKLPMCQFAPSASIIQPMSTPASIGEKSFALSGTIGGLQCNAKCCANMA